MKHLIIFCVATLLLATAALGQVVEQLSDAQINAQIEALKREQALRAHLQVPQPIQAQQPVNVQVHAVMAPPQPQQIFICGITGQRMVMVQHHYQPRPGAVLAAAAPHIVDRVFHGIVMHNMTRPTQINIHQSRPGPGWNQNFTQQHGWNQSFPTQFGHPQQRPPFRW